MARTLTLYEEGRNKETGGGGMGADTPPHTLPYYSNVLSNIKEGRAIWIKIKAGIRTQMRSILGPSKRNLVEFHRISLTKPISSILGPSKRNLVEFHRISLTKTANPNTASPPPPLFLRLLKYNRRHPT